jgi:hypothetical protein
VPIPALATKTDKQPLLRLNYRLGWPTILLATGVLLATPLVGAVLFSFLRHLNREGWLCVVSIALVLILAPLVGSLVLGPVNRAAGRLNTPTRFLLPDFMWLVVQLQLALGYCVSFVGIQQIYFFVLVLGFFTLASVMMWAGAVSFLSRAGVRNSLRRGIFILLLLPGTLALMIATPLLPVVSYILETDGTSVEQLFRLSGSLPPHSGILLFVTGGVCMTALGIAVHLTSRWLVGGLETSQSAPLFNQPAA